MDEKLIEAAELIENKFQTGGFRTLTAKLPESYPLNVTAEHIVGVCLDGAVRHVYDYYNDSWNGRPSGGSLQYWESLRRVRSVAPTFPNCPECADLRTDGSTWPDVIHHYNDEHCDGGVGAAKLLREAAEVEL